MALPSVTSRNCKTTTCLCCALRTYTNSGPAHETANMILSASLMRKESRCSHYRLDYPKMDDTNWRAWINIYKGADGTVQLEKQPFSTWATRQPS